MLFEAVLGQEDVGGIYTLTSVIFVEPQAKLEYQERESSSIFVLSNYIVVISGQFCFLDGCNSYIMLSMNLRIPCSLCFRLLQLNQRILIEQVVGCGVVAVVVVVAYIGGLGDGAFDEGGCAGGGGGGL